MVLVEGDDGATGGVHGQRADPGGADAGQPDGLAHRWSDGRPPVFRVLLGPAGGGKIGLVGGGGKRQRCAMEIKNAGAQAFGAAVNTQNARIGAHVSCLHQSVQADIDRADRRRSGACCAMIILILSRFPASGNRFSGKPVSDHEFTGFPAMGESPVDPGQPGDRTKAGECQQILIKQDNVFLLLDLSGLDAFNLLQPGLDPGQQQIEINRF